MEIDDRPLAFGQAIHLLPDGEALVKVVAAEGDIDSAPCRPVPTPDPMPIDGQVVHDAKEPGVEIVDRFGASATRPEEGLLHRVFGVVRVEAEPASERPKLSGTAVICLLQLVRRRRRLDVRHRGSHDSLTNHTLEMAWAIRTLTRACRESQLVFLTPP